MTVEPVGRSEFEVIAAVRRAVARGSAEGVRLGIGDDAAVLAVPAGHELVTTTDLLVEDVHFTLRRGGASARDVGWKALAVSISDVAAMGGRALWAVVSVALPPSRTGSFADELVGGLAECAALYGTALVGGDTTGSPGPLVVNVCVSGCVPEGGAVTRGGARPGDGICVTGALGGSLLGRHLHPMPRQVEALSLVQGGSVHAMIDLSDGLSSDLGHVLDASGVGARLWRDRIPVHSDADDAARDSGRSPLAHAMDDGEDFELLFTLPAERAETLERSGLAGTAVTRIGVVTEQRSYLLCADERSADGEPVKRRGHDHFRRR